ncbi:MAG: iron-sulfur cluster insertion protein ErpA [Alphaproteobacteria bacterium]|nr:MAG: iron-sulfur cluster insertion protein ErpA [Alphaproteobacteria bacterium]
MDAETQKQEIFITDSAAQQIARLIKKTGQPEGAMLRVTVTGGGCSGFQYAFDFDTETSAADDVIFEKDGAKVVTDMLSLNFLDQSAIDYVSDLGAAGFKISNPNAVASCGCGNSFSVDMG